MFDAEINSSFKTKSMVKSTIPAIEDVSKISIAIPPPRSIELSLEIIFSHGISFPVPKMLMVFLKNPLIGFLMCLYFGHYKP